jgi:transcriptional regulator with XRE-family HTH domain
MAMTLHEPRQKNFPVMKPEELRAAREEMGLTQQEAADKYEISHRGYKNYELGLRPIPGPVKILTALLLEKHRKISQ